jgi:hypothetical protein
MAAHTIFVTRGKDAIPNHGFGATKPDDEVLIKSIYDDEGACWQMTEEVLQKPRGWLQACGWRVVELNLPDANPRDAKFADDIAIVGLADSLIRERLESLCKDVSHCLKEPFAPFPALLYCFATVDFLAALYAGDVTRNAKGPIAKTYMTQVMGYREEQAQLLQTIYRHKLVHLAQPRAVLRDGARLISWRYVHERHPQHLQLNQIPKGWVRVTPQWYVVCEWELFLSIQSLVDDIVRSVEAAPAGYLHRVAHEAVLQANLKKALTGMFDPDQP